MLKRYCNQRSGEHSGKNRSVNAAFEKGKIAIEWEHRK